MQRFILFVGLWASTAFSAQTVVVLQLTAGPGVGELAATVTEQVQTELQKQGHKVMGTSDLAAMLGLERQKQLLGCASADSSSCMAELTGALGAEFLVSGAISRLGATLRVDLKLLRTSTGAVVLRVGKEATTDQLFATVSDLVDNLNPSIEPPRAARVGQLLLGTAGTLMAVGGGIAIAFGHDSAAKLDVSTRSYASARTTLNEAATTVNVGIGLLAAGGITLISAIIWAAFTEAAVVPTVAVSPTGAGFFVTGVW